MGIWNEKILKATFPDTYILFDILPELHKFIPIIPQGIRLEVWYDLVRPSDSFQGRRIPAQVPSGLGEIRSLYMLGADASPLPRRLAMVRVKVAALIELGPEQKPWNC